MADPNTNTQDPQSQGLINFSANSNQVIPPSPTAAPTTATSPPAVAAASTADATGYTAVPFEVKPDQTVAGNVDSLLSADSPLMQRAVARANAQANQRGLLNSSLAVSAGQSALYDAATPIATTDAQIKAQAATNTANATNAARQFGAGAINTAALTNAQLNTGISQSNAASANAQTLQKIQADTSLTMQDKQVQSQQLIAANENAVQQQIAALQASTQLSAVDKQTQMQKLINDADNLTQQGIASIQANTQMSIADKQSAIQDLVSQRTTQTQLSVAKMNADSALANIDADGRIKANLAGIEASYKQLMQSQASAGDLYKSMLAAMTSIATDPNVADKPGAMNNAVAALNDGLDILGRISNLNLGTQLHFDGPDEAAPVAPTGGSTTPPWFQDFINNRQNATNYSDGDPGTGP